MKTELFRLLSKALLQAFYEEEEEDIAVTDGKGVHITKLLQDLVGAKKSRPGPGKRS